MVFYFTATGNSLYVAKQFSKCPISIAQEMKKDELCYEAESIGIVIPDFGGELPKIVRRFLQRATFQTEYLYLVVTYGKNDSVVSEWAYYYGKSQHIHFDYINTILVVDNYLPSFDMNEEVKLDKKIEQQLVKIKTDITSKKKYVKHPSQQQRDLYEMVSRSNERVLDGSEIVINSEKCIGCGMCTLVCPIGNFFLKDGEAQRYDNHCEYCLACVHHCSNKAITTKVDKNPNARYINKNIKISEIIQANSQYQEVKTIE